MDTPPPTPIDLSECAREPIHVPGSVQPHGLFAAATEPDLAIVQVGANADRFCGLRAEALIGRKLDALLGAGEVANLRAALASAGTEAPPAYLMTLHPLAFERPVNAIAHRSEGLLVLELEPAASNQAASFNALYPLARTSLGRLEGADSVSELCRAAAGEVRRLTGFDRVMVYRFHPDWHGEVIAEDADAALPPFLGLHFPATDIPEQARRLYTVNRLRLIPDVGYRPVPIVPPNNPLTGRPTDLSQSALRSVSPVHVEYLQNMGVGASMSVSVMRGGELWGLIACHHRTARFLPFEVRHACDFVGQVLAVQLAAHETAHDARDRIRLKTAYTRLIGHMASRTDFLDGLAEHGQELIDFVGAGGVATFFGGRTVLTGRTPAPPDVEALVQWLSQGPVATRTEEELFHTDALPSLYPPAERFKDVAPGLLAVSVSRVHRSYVLWFRPEVVRTVTWSGDPHAPAVEVGDRRLHPRRSFEAWKQTVAGRSLPWREAELAAAADLRSAVVGIVLKRAEEVAQLARALEKSNQELEAFSYTISHDLRAPFRHIAGFAELLHKRAAATLDDTSRRYLDTIVDSARHAGRLVDSLLSFTQIGRRPLNVTEVDADALARTVVAEVRAESDGRGRAAEWSFPGRLPRVTADATMFHSALRNLLSNALKYSRDRDPPRIEVTAREGPGGEVVFTVRDNGVGFDMKYADKLFSVFQRLHRAEEFPGTGIGLASVKRIVERHGGRVWAESEPGAGAAFSFSLPGGATAGGA